MGATGPTGGALLDRLVALGVPSRALSRDPDRIRARFGDQTEARRADATEPDSLRAAFTGASQLFLTMVNSPAQVDIETRAIRIAVEAGVEHIVKLSAPNPAPDSPVAIARWHHAIEEVLRGSGVTHTELRPYAFMQKLVHLAPAVAARGVIHGAMRDAACNYIDCRDIGDVAAAALTRPEVAGGAYTLTGSRAVSYPELADLLSTLLDRRIRYVDLPPDQLRRDLVEHAGMPGWLAAHLVEIQQLAVDHLEEPTDTVARLLGRPPRTLEDFLRENLGHFRLP
ncbi:SDR family oxidoreductase [Solihabitans fulvus]|nr:SDR family oxidoreductase [Solihabitans fulvus]